MLAGAEVCKPIALLCCPISCGVRFILPHIEFSRYNSAHKAVTSWTGLMAIECAERDELVANIAQCLSALSVISAASSTEAQTWQHDSVDTLRARQAKRAVYSDRLKSLRESLDLHKRWHGC
jgi:hypothetical protein